jgi:DNA-binding transcriptional MerR regulator
MKSNESIAAKVERLAYTKAELCEALRVSPVTLWRLEKKGLLEPVAGLRHKLYSKAAVERFIEGGAA